MVGISPSTVRSWTAEFGEHFSECARPAKGEERAYTDEDLSTLFAIKVFRDQNQDNDAIRVALSNENNSHYPADTELTVMYDENLKQEAAVAASESTPFAGTRLAQLEGELEAVKAERDRLKRELEKERVLVDGLRERAAAAETRVSSVEVQQSEMDKLRERLDTTQRNLEKAQKKYADLIHRTATAEAELESFRRMQRWEVAANELLEEWARHERNRRWWQFWK